MLESNFFTTLRFRDPFYSATNDTEMSVTYEEYDLLVQETRDALDNRITAGIRNLKTTLPVVKTGLDYRLIKSILVMDANGNCGTLAHNVLGFMAGSAVLGKPESNEGDSLDGVDVNLPEDMITAHFVSKLFRTTAS